VDLTICTWVWGRKYGAKYIERLAAGVERNLKQPFRFRVFSPQAEDEHLTDIPGCFARLRMFDPKWQAEHKIRGRLVCMDLDLIVTGGLDELFDRPDDLVILQGANASNPCPYNGSVFMLQAGTHQDVWADFSLEAARETAFYSFPDDQGWFSHKIPGAAGWKCGSGSGVYAFKKPGWPRGDDLPADARIVAFPGHRDPSQFTHLDWVKKHWAA
jgi:hypothetical protein